MNVQWWIGSQIEDRNIISIIEAEVQAVDSERGELEDMAEKITLLAKMVGQLVEQLPPAQAKNFVQETCYHWVVK